MSIRSIKLRRILQTLVPGLILIVLFLNISAKKSQNSYAVKVEKLLQESNTQNIFADPAKKSRPEWPEFILVEDLYIQAVLPPVVITPQVLGVLVEGFGKEDVQKIIVEYIVEPGDTFWTISQEFNVSLNTILWANNLNQNTLIQPGQKLIIPPVSGVIHHVKDGDTVSDIAKKYKAKTEEIVDFNNLSSEADIFVGDILIVPNGVISVSVPSYASTWVPLAKSSTVPGITLQFYIQTAWLPPMDILPQAS
jgi:LysM repeat protein